MPTDEKAVGPPSTGAETALDVASFVTSAVPWMGGPVSAVLSGISTGRKLGRVREVVEGLVEDLRSFKSEVSEKYVKTDEFHELLENTLRRAADERTEEKRRLYRSFLTQAITSGGAPYDEQMKVLRTLDEVQPDHVRVLRALLDEPRPEADLGIMGSQLQTLARRLPGLPRDHIERLVGELNDLRLTSLQSLHTMMTAHGAENLRHALTPLGSRFLAFVLGT
jgi:hypothetical protein